MPKKVIQQITAWSFSRLNDWRKCPQMAKFKHVDKLKEPGSKAMDRGSAIDKLAEDFCKPAAKKLPCPPELASFEEEFRQLQKLHVVTQEQWAFTSGWALTGWFDGDAWARLKTDIYTLNKKDKILTVIDVKTGKIREEHEEQVELYGLGGLLRLPSCEGVDVRLWYTDQGVEHPEKETIYTHDQLPLLKESWNDKVQPMLTDRRFTPKPGHACTWCHFRKQNGGPCKF